MVSRYFRRCKMRRFLSAKWILRKVFRSPQTFPSCKPWSNISIFKSMWRSILDSKPMIYINLYRFPGFGCIAGGGWSSTAPPFWRPHGPCSAGSALGAGAEVRGLDELERWIPEIKKNIGIEAIHGNSPIANGFVLISGLPHNEAPI